MKNKEEILNRLAYNKATGRSAKQVVEELIKDKEVKALVDGKHGVKIIKWLMANVTWSMSMARQNELEWVLGQLEQ